MEFPKGEMFFMKAISLILRNGTHYSEGMIGIGQWKYKENMQTDD